FAAKNKSSITGPQTLLVAISLLFPGLVKLLKLDVFKSDWLIYFKTLSEAIMEE
ncbi:unnamed protein product, partial [Ixodes pacificus]